MKKILLITLMIFGLQTVQAQYQHALGVRGTSTVGFGRAGSGGLGVTFKTFLDELSAIDLTASGFVLVDPITGANSSWFVVTGLFEIHKPMAFLDNFSFYYGGGLHVGAAAGVGVNGGIDGVFGAEWIFPFAPEFAVSADVIPSLTFSGIGIWGGVTPTVGAKWIFAK